MAATARLLPAFAAAAAALLLLLCLAGGARATNVTYDHRALVIDGVRRVLVSGSIHYPRSTPDVRILPPLFISRSLPAPAARSFLCSWQARYVLTLAAGMACRRQMWPGIIQKAKDGGLDVIETYVFWDIHEPVRGQARTN